MKIAIVVEVLPEALQRIQQMSEGSYNERIEVQFQNIRGQPLPMVNVTWASMSCWCPAMVFRVDDRLPLGESLVLAETGHYKPDPDEIKRIVERMKDARAGRDVLRTHFSIVWRTLRPVAISEAIDKAIGIIHAADPLASTLWRFTDGDLFAVDAKV